MTHGPQLTILRNFLVKWINKTGFLNYQTCRRHRRLPNLGFHLSGRKIKQSLGIVLAGTSIMHKDLTLQCRVHMEIILKILCQSIILRVLMLLGVAAQSFYLIELLVCQGLMYLCHLGFLFQIEHHLLGFLHMIDTTRISTHVQKFLSILWLKSQSVSCLFYWKCW
ncbi:uncharacterized protein M6B38_203745 [Iris pallida]|uniref:Uncharacterized protein n=1 Tax=Iris pallida TaxID=29817 RepID=A0AAX6E785_IRIPA|nr:uncharacterized protein M6B38_203745 [Iris pallida]